MEPSLCRCGNLARDNQRTCLRCHSERMREFRHKRKTYDPEANRRSLCRSYLNTYVRRGKIIKPDTCSECGIWWIKIEAHHEDYSKPLEVVWLCRQCHIDITTGVRKLRSNLPPWSHPDNHC